VRPSRRLVALATVATAGAGYATVFRLGRRWGATDAECAAAMAGDAAIEHPALITTHAATIDAPPEAIWPWMMQVGWHQGGWYTPQWVDRLLFPANWPSADHLLEGYPGLQIGDQVPDGPPDTAYFVVEEVVPARILLLHSRTHVPPAWRDDPRIRAWIDWTWSFELTPLDGDRTRMRFRTRADVGPCWLKAAYLTLIVPADFYMSRGMLRGIAARATTGTRSGVG